MKKRIAVSVSAMLAIIISALNLFFYLSQASELEDITNQATILQQENQSMRQQLYTDRHCLNPGNSGGALAKFNGGLLGINVAKYVDVDIEGIGLAIPVCEVKNKISEYAG